MSTPAKILDLFHEPVQPENASHQPSEQPIRNRDQRFRQQLRRIDEYRDADVEDPIKCARVIRAAASDLLELLARVSNAILTVCDASNLTLESLSEYAIGFDACLRLSKQTDQFVRLEKLVLGTDGTARRNRPR
jgi:hypothetical protein